MNLSGKHVILGVTGSIAAYKSAYICSILKKQNADVTVIMTKNALNFINPITFETLTGNKCLTDTFDRNFSYSVEHVELSKKADVFLIAPSSADILAKASCGIADDMLTTTLLACTCPVIFAPAMNTGMYNNRITKRNIKTLEDFGYEVLKPDCGYLACGDIGEGKMPEPEVLVEYIKHAVSKKDFAGKKVLVTAGPTMESIDPVRCITNHSSGKMGYALSKEAYYRGAYVTLISGKTALKKPVGVDFVEAVSASDMAKEVIRRKDDYDIIIKAAAVADYTPAKKSSEKIKKKDEDLCINLIRTRDILSYLGNSKKEGQFICGFSMETENLIENSKKKLISKNVDMIVANSLKDENAGFESDTNLVTIIEKEQERTYPLLSKEDISEIILSRILEICDK